MLFVIKRFLKLLLTVSEFSPLAILWMLKSFVFDFVAAKISFKRLPKIVEKTGLRHVPSEDLKQFGELRGTIEGYRVHVRPQEHIEPVISVSFPSGYQGLEIKYDKPRYRAKKNVVDFTTSSWKFDRIFETKRAKQEMAVMIQNNKQFLNCVVAFYSRWIFRLAFLMIHENEIFCKLKSPDRIGFFPYIPAGQVNQLVAGLVNIAKCLDAALSANDKK